MNGKLEVKQIRGMLGLTQREFAKKLGMKYVTYASKEKGNRRWLAEEITKISMVSNVDIANIII